MKTIIVFLVSVLIYTTTSFSQEKDADTLKIKSVTVQSGQGAITSGLYVIGSAGNSKIDFEAIFSSNDLYCSYRWKLFDDIVSVGPSGGYFYNSIWLGPQMFIFLGKHISTLSWFCFSAGEIKFDGSAETEIAKWRKMGFINGVYFNTADWFGDFSVGLGYTSINWLKEIPKSVVGIKLSNRFGEANKWTYATDISYELRDKKMLY